MDAETTRLLISGLLTLAASILTALITVTAAGHSALKQRKHDELKWSREHRGEVFASVHAAILSLKFHIHNVMYQGEGSEPEVIGDLSEKLNAQLSRLVYVADSDIIEPAMKARYHLEELFDAAALRPISTVRSSAWERAHQEFTEAFAIFTTRTTKALGYAFTG